MPSCRPGTGAPTNWPVIHAVAGQLRPTSTATWAAVSVEADKPPRRIDCPAREMDRHLHPCSAFGSRAVLLGRAKDSNESATGKESGIETGTQRQLPNDRLIADRRPQPLPRQPFGCFAMQPFGGYYGARAVLMKALIHLDAHTGGTPRAGGTQRLPRRVGPRPAPGSPRPAWSTTPGTYSPGPSAPSQWRQRGQAAGSLFLVAQLTSR